MFWRMAGLSTASPVETILDKENFTLEELLDEDEIIQECKSLNGRLINFLRERAQVEQLIRYIVEQALEDADKQRSFKFPFIACEIFTCEVDIILKAMVEDEELMNLLFSFLDPERPHATQLAGYFSKVVVCLLLRKTTTLMNYIQVDGSYFHKIGKKNMKESGRERNRGNVKSAVEKERTKMRERQRRSITTKIFHGLRQHGGYHLTPRSDINQVLRHLAQEAGWVVEPDGTTYRSTPATSNGNSVCPLCARGRKMATPTPTSFMEANGMHGVTANGSGGEYSNTVMSRQFTIKDPTLNSLPYGSGCGSSSSRTTPGATAVSSSCSYHRDDTLMAIYMCAVATPQKFPTTVTDTTALYHKGQPNKTLNQNTVVQSSHYHT